MEVDHIIPESTTTERLAELIEKLELGNDFHVDSVQNLVPTHHDCNRRKSNSEFTEGPLMYYLELWKRKQSTVSDALKTLERQRNKERLLTALATQIEQGYLSVPEITAYIEEVRPPAVGPTSEPWVITFGARVLQILESRNASPDAEIDYPSLCDELEEDLMKDLRAQIPGLSVQTEASARSGETLSFRVAFWNLDFSRLEELNVDPWEVLEVAPYSELYESGWDEHFPNAVLGAYKDLVSDPDDTFFGIGRCPECLSKELRRGNVTDDQHDELYYYIECEYCDWSQWE